MTDYLVSFPLAFRFDQTRTLVTLDEAGNDSFECFKLNDYPLLFCISVCSITDEEGNIVSEKYKKFGYFLV